MCVRVHTHAYIGTGIDKTCIYRGYPIFCAAFPLLIPVSIHVLLSAIFQLARCAFQMIFEPLGN